MGWRRPGLESARAPTTPGWSRPCNTTSCNFCLGWSRPQPPYHLSLTTPTGWSRPYNTTFHGNICIGWCRPWLESATTSIPPSPSTHTGWSRPPLQPPTAISVQAGVSHINLTTFPPHSHWLVSAPLTTFHIGWCRPQHPLHLPFPLPRAGVGPPHHTPQRDGPHGF